jgi:hypothetical protein
MNADKVLQVAPKEFYDAYAKHTELSLEQGVTARMKILYEYMSALGGGTIHCFHGSHALNGYLKEGYYN